MTQASIAELVESWRPGYLRASRNAALTGYQCKSAICLLRNGRKPKHLDRRGRPRAYPGRNALLERLALCLPKIVAMFKIRPETEKLLVRMSAATMERLLCTTGPCRK